LSSGTLVNQIFGPPQPAASSGVTADRAESAAG
jgi:hypothetical protein